MTERIPLGFGSTRTRIGLCQSLRRSQDDPSAPFSVASDRYVTPTLTDEQRTNDQGLTAMTGGQACDLLLPV
jgi:hypothetical protein